MARGPAMEVAPEAPADGSATAASKTSEGEAIAMLMQSMRCDAETARQMLAQLRERMEEKRAGKEKKRAIERRKARIEEFQYSADKQWIDFRRFKNARGPVTDDLAARYSALADDTSEGGKKREAAMMFAAAEAHLNDEEDWQQGHKAANEALNMYRAAGDATGEADSLRLVIHAIRLKCEMAQWDYTLGENIADEARQEAESLASNELGKFASSGNTRGQATMSLSMAEIFLDDRRPGSYKKLGTAEDLISQASKVFQELGDKKMEARCMVAASRTRCLQYRFQIAAKTAKEALDIYRSISDQRGEVTAIMVLASALAQSNETESALESAQEALSLAQSLSVKKAQAHALLLIARLQLDRSKPREVVAYSQEALDLFQELDYGMGWASAAESLMVEAYMTMDNDAKALEAATAGVERCQQGGDRREMVFSRTTLARAYLSSEDFPNALREATAAVDLCRDLNDKSWEAMASLSVAQVHALRNDPAAATDAVQAAVEIFQEDEDSHHEAVCSVLLSDMFLMKSDADTAMQAAHKGRDLFRLCEETDQEEVALFMVSQVHGFRREFDKAISVAEEAIEISQNVGDRKGEAMGLRLLSEWHMAQGAFDKAMEAAKTCRKLYQELRNTKLEASTLHHVGTLHLDNNEPKVAAKAAEAAAKICIREKLTKDLVMMQLLVGEAYMKVMEIPATRLDDPKQARMAMDAASKAVKATKEATDIAERLGSLQLQAIATLTYARACYQSGMAEQAVDASERSRVCCSQMMDRYGEAQALVVTGQAAFQVDGQRLKAEQAATEALNIFKEIEDAQGEKVAEDLLKMLGVDLRAPAGMYVPMPGAEGGWAEGGAPQMGAVSSVAEPEKPKGMDPVMVNYTVRELAKGAIGADDDLHADSPLMDMGMDSLTVVSFRNSLQQTLGMKLPSSLVFDYPTTKMVSQKIVELSLADA